MTARMPRRGSNLHCNGQKGRQQGHSECSEEIAGCQSRGWQVWAFVSLFLTCMGLRSVHYAMDQLPCRRHVPAKFSSSFREVSESFRSAWSRGEDPTAVQRGAKSPECSPGSAFWKEWGAWCRTRTHWWGRSVCAMRARLRFVPYCRTSVQLRQIQPPLTEELQRGAWGQVGHGAGDIGILCLK